MNMTHSRHIKRWAKNELNLELGESHIGDLIDKNKFLAKVLTYSATRVKNKKHSQKYVNCATISEIYDEIDDNNHQFGKMYQNGDRSLSPAVALHERCLHLKRLFQYTFEQEFFRVSERFDRGKAEECHEIIQKMIEMLRQVETYSENILSRQSSNASADSPSTDTFLEPHTNLKETFDSIRSHVEMILRDLNQMTNYDFMHKKLCCKVLQETERGGKTDHQLKEIITQLSSLLKNWIQLMGKIEERTNILTYV